MIVGKLRRRNSNRDDVTQSRVAIIAVKSVGTPSPASLVSCLLPDQFQFCRNRLVRTVAGHDLHLAGLNHEMHRSIVVAELFRTEQELSDLLLSGHQRHSLKSFELLHWP